MAEAQRYPLAWPAGWKRTPAAERRPAAFRTRGPTLRNPATGALVPGRERPLDVADAVERLERELRLLDATGEVLSTNVALRLDGRHRPGQAEARDPGAAVYFRLKDQPLCLACDRWTRVADNIAAIAQHIDALRRIDRYGVGSLEQAFAGYAMLPPSPDEWWLTLELPRTASLVEVEEAFRRLAKTAHPDAGGTHDRMARLTAARAAARKALGAPA